MLKNLIHFAPKYSFKQALFLYFFYFLTSLLLAAFLSHFIILYTGVQKESAESMTGEILAFLVSMSLTLAVLFAKRMHKDPAALINLAFTAAFSLWGGTPLGLLVAGFLTTRQGKESTDKTMEATLTKNGEAKLPHQERDRGE